jgi:hypothetical protein
MSFRKDAEPSEGPLDKAIREHAERCANAYKGDHTEAEINEAARKAKEAAPNKESSGPVVSDRLENARKEAAWRSRNQWRGEAWLSKNSVGKPWLRDE